MTLFPFDLALSESHPEDGMPDDAFTLVFAGDIRNVPNPLTTETPFGVAIGAADGDLMEKLEEIEDGFAPSVIIPRPQYEAMMGAARALDKLCDTDKQFVAGEAFEALRAIRAAGINLEGEGE